jgi:type II secretory pathway pseudopilin PulG
MRRRHAFTIVELLVAMALIILIMSVLSQSFVAATASLRDLKALGDMAQRLREARSAIVRDVAADHFEGRKKLSDPSFWDNGPPREGLFRIWQDPLSPSVLEGTDVDGIRSYRSTGHILHFTVKLRGNQRSDFMSALVPGTSPLYQFTLAPGLGLPDRRYQDTTTPTGEGVYNSQWAEVEYFLRAVVDQTGKQDNANGVPLFALFRRQQLAVPDNSLIPAVTAANPPDHVEVSTTPIATPPPAGTALHFNSPLDLTMPARRFGSATAPAAAAAAGVLGGSDPITGRLTYPTKSEQNSARYFPTDDLLLTDVLSFDVRVLLPGNTDFVDLFDNISTNKVQSYNTLLNPHYYNLASIAASKLPAVFDTWSNATDDTYDYNALPTPGAVVPIWQASNKDQSIPLYQNAAGQKIRIVAIQITLRVWDFKTKQARQITIVQDL